MSKNIVESATLSEATKSTDSGLLEVEFITPGWGSSGYYSREVVEAAAPLFAVGVQMYFDHPTPTEEQERPVRSVRDIAAVIESAGVVDKATGAVRGKVRPLKIYEGLLTDEAFAKNVGLSIRGSASDITVGEAEGRKGPIIEGLSHLASVDFVTRAGRGGKVLAVLESALADDVAVAEATASDRMGHLRTALRATYGSSGRGVYVRDMDAESAIVWFDLWDNRSDVMRTYQQAYSVGANDVDVALTGEATEVRQVTNYVPVTRPDSSNPTTEADQEVTMGNISIEESEHTRLVTEAGRVDALLAENTTLKAENTELKESNASRDRADAAVKIIKDVAEDKGVAFSALEAKGLIGQLPLKEGELDVEKFTASVVTEAASKAAAGGAGTVSGFGGTSTGPDAIKESDIDKAVAGTFGRTVKEA